MERYKGIMFQINGKVEDDVRKIRGIEELSGVKAKNVFGVESEEELNEKMADMTLIDLQKMAVSSGVSGGGTRAVLKEKLRREFIRFKHGGHGLASSVGGQMKLKGKDKKRREKEVFKLMTEGI